MQDGMGGERISLAPIYSLFGLRVRSDVPLPAALCAVDESRVDVVFQRRQPPVYPEPDGPVFASVPCPIHGEDLRLNRGPGGAWIWQRAVGTFHVTPDLHVVEVYPDDGADERAIGLGLTGPVILFILQVRGTPILHAGAVVTSAGAVAFLGRKGQGKSTMTSAFVRRGAPLLTDDALPLQVYGGQLCGTPGPPYMKVWRQTALHALDISDELANLFDNTEKKFLGLEGRYSFTQEPLPLRSIYLLARYDPRKENRSDITIRGLSPLDCLSALLAFTSMQSFLLPVEVARFLPLYARLSAQVPLRVLTYPSGFEYQEAVHAQVLADLEVGN